MSDLEPSDPAEGCLIPVPALLEWLDSWEDEIMERLPETAFQSIENNTTLTDIGCIRSFLLLTVAHTHKKRFDEAFKLPSPNQESEGDLL